LIPQATRIAWSLKSNEIKADEPGATHRKFLYNLSRSEYEKQWGKDYQRPSRKERFYAFSLQITAEDRAAEGAAAEDSDARDRKNV